MLTSHTSRKAILFIVSIFLSSFIFAQSCQECDEEINLGGELLRCENFENAAPNSPITNLPNWTLAIGTNKVTPLATSAASYQGNRSVKVEFAAQAADVNFQFNAAQPNFDYHIGAKLFVPSNKTAQVRLLDFAQATKYIIDFGKNDTAFVKASATGTPVASFRYPKGQWFRLSQMIRAADKRMEIFIGGKKMVNIVLPNPTVGIPSYLNINASSANASFLIDNICAVKNQKTGFIPNCPTVTEAYCIGGDVSDLQNECTLGFDKGYIPLEYTKGNCNATLGCTPTCSVEKGCFDYYINKDNKIYCYNNFCEVAGLTYEWSILSDATTYSFTNGTTKTSKNIVLLPTQAQTFTIIEKVSDASGKVVNSCSSNIIYNPSACLETPVLNLQYQSLGQNRFIITTPNSQNISNLSWEVLDVNNNPVGPITISGDNPNPEFIKSKNGLIKVVATAKNECGVARTAYEISDATCQQGCPTAIDLPTNITPVLNAKLLTFKGLPTGAAYTYTWRVVGFDNILIPAVASPTINLPDFSTYTVCCEVVKTVGTCVNRTSLCFNVKAEDDAACFDTPCSNIDFLHSNVALKPLQYTFKAGTNVTKISSWRVKNLTTNQVSVIASTTLSQNIDFADAKFGGAGNYAVAYKFIENGIAKCCGIKVKIDNPTTCGIANVNFAYDNQTSSYVFTGTPTGGVWFSDTTFLATPTLAVSSPCVAKTISYRSQDAAGFSQICAKKISLCPPAECNKFDLGYQASSQSLILDLKNIPANATNFSWTEEDNKKLISNSRKITYPFTVTSPCVPTTYAARYFDGIQWNLCSKQVLLCNPDDCAVSIAHTYNENTSNGQLLLSTNLPNISNQKWYIDDSPAQNINQNIKPGKYKITLVYFDETNQYFKICSKNIKIGDNCFQTTDCGNLNFFFNNNPTKPLQYTFSALTTGVVTQWRIRSVATGKIVTSNSGPVQVLDFALYGGEGEYIICYEYDQATSGDISGCCCSKVCISNPFTCGENSINYEYNPAKNSFFFTYLGQIAGGNGEWVKYVVGGNPEVIPNGEVILSANCTTETIGFRFKDATSNCERICYRSIYLCNPSDCQEIDIAYKASAKSLIFNLKNNTGITKYNWKEDESKITFGTQATAAYDLTKGNCDKRTISARYFDGQKWLLCSVPVYSCDAANCETSINENIANNKFSSISVDAAFTNVTWYNGDTKAGTGNSFDVTTLTPGDYLMSALYFDNSAKYYRVCSKTITIGDDCFVKSDCKDITFFYSGKAKGELKYAFTVQNPSNIINWQIKREGDANATNITTTNGSIEIDFSKYSGEGDYTICASKPNGCCCIKLAVIDPTTCGDVDYKFDATKNTFDFTFTKTGNITKADWLDEAGKVISATVATSIPAAPCGTRTISYRYYDVAANIFRYCSRKVFVCNPLECKNILLTYAPNTKEFGLNLVNVPVASSDFAWQIDDAAVISTDKGFTYQVPTTPACKKQIFSIKYFDGEKWAICAVPIFVCNPSDCGANVTYTYSKSLLTFTPKANYSEITYYINNSKVKEKDNSVLPGDYTLTMFYFDNTLKQYQVCSQQVTLDDECIQDATCDNIAFYQSGGINKPLEFTFVAKNLTGVTGWKVKKVGGTTTDVLTGATNSKLIDFSTLGGAGDYIICATNPTICCCMKIRIADPFACKDIDFQFDKNAKNYNLYFKNTAISKTQWLLEDPGKAPQELSANILNLQANCVSRLVSFRYFDDVNKIWAYCTQNFFLCDPFVCGDQTIFYAYQNNAGKDDFNFLLNDINFPTYKDLTWQVEGAKPVFLPLNPDKSANFYPPAGQDCKPYVVSAKYYDPAFKNWHFCSINVNICNPDKCNTIDVGYKASVKQYEFSANAPAQSKGFRWTIEEIQALIGDKEKTPYIVPANFTCKTYTIGVRYFDGTAWRLCTKKVFLCDPTKCASEIKHDYDIDNSGTKGTLTLTNTNTNIFKTKWYQDDVLTQAVKDNVALGTYQISTVYEDAQGVTKICSKKITLDLLPKFTLVANKVTVSPVQEAVIDIRSKNFSNLANFQVTLTWNPAVLKLTSPENFFFKGKTDFNTAQQNSGSLGIMWSADNPIIGQSYPDNAVLYKIRFAVVGKIGDESIIDFTDKALTISVKDINGSEVPFGKETGSVKIATTAINDVESAAKYFSIYPNPTSDRAVIDFDPALVKIQSLTLYDQQGRVVQSQKEFVPNAASEIDLSDAANGIYLLKIQANDTFYIYRLVKM